MLGGPGVDIGKEGDGAIAMLGKSSRRSPHTMLGDNEVPALIDLRRKKRQIR
jgi:hypothetical protein